MARYYPQIRPGGLAGGGASFCERNEHEVVYCKSCIDVEFLFNVGDVKQAFVGARMGSETATVRITESKTKEMAEGWIDVCKYERISGAPIAPSPVHSPVHSSSSSASERAL